MLAQKTGYLNRLAVALLLACSGTQTRAELQPVGLAVFTETARDVYVAALLLPPGSRLEHILLAPGPKAMEYRIALRRISSRGFYGMLLLQGELGTGSRASEQVIAAVGTLRKNIKSAFKQGDHFVITLSENDVTSFELNGVELLSIDDSSIFDFFLAGWVGGSSSGLLRDALLSGDLDIGMLTRFESLAPTGERVTTIADWMGLPPVPSPAPQQAVPVQATAAAARPRTVPPPAAERVAAPLATKKPADKTTGIARVRKTAADADAPDIDDREYQRQLSEYVTHIMKKIFRKVVYPKLAIRRDHQGKVELLVTVDENGNLLEISLDSSSGYDALDFAASKAVRKAAPFPELTLVARKEFLADDGASYIMPIPITFKLNN